jgi:hypothetical protein
MDSNLRFREIGLRSGSVNRLQTGTPLKLVVRLVMARPPQTADTCHDRKPDPWQMAAAPAWARPQLTTSGISSLR